jgi:hypothetical protein
LSIFPLQVFYRFRRPQTETDDVLTTSDGDVSTMAKFLRKGRGDHYEINLEGRRGGGDSRGLRRQAKEGAAIQDYGSFTSLLNNEVSCRYFLLMFESLQFRKIKF